MRCVSREEGKVVRRELVALAQSLFARQSSRVLGLDSGCSWPPLLPSCKINLVGHRTAHYAKKVRKPRRCASRRLSAQVWELREPGLCAALDDDEPRLVDDVGVDDAAIV